MQPKKREENKMITAVVFVLLGLGISLCLGILTGMIIAGGDKR